MLGAILGDIVGSVYEFRNTKDYHFELFPEGCSYTDDTILTVAVADWALSDPAHSLSRLERTLVRYGQKYPCPTGGYGGGFQTWLFAPEQLLDYEDSGRKGKRHPYHSWGNGAAMRVSSIGWLFDTLQETERIAALSASVTHNHPEGIKGAQATAAAIFMARNGASKEEIRSYISAQYGYDLSRSWELLHETYRWDSSCQGTVPEALICFLESRDFEDALRRAVSIGGDSDTLACITGGVAEAFYRRIPDFMLQKAFLLLPKEFMKVYERMLDVSRLPRYRFTQSSRNVLSGRVTPRQVNVLKPDEIFVFGSNINGFHGGGAAYFAMEHFGAVWGQGEGLQGRCYALPTMEGIVSFERAVERFLDCARRHPELHFLVTPVGCGIAGYRASVVAQFFREAIGLENVSLPEMFWKVLRPDAF